ncbi:hypothetical protein [Nocardia sp. XZ_19_385]|uniref:hypothetical protein n=1 Tax=Nocardia sp. XZ_19_385 TaxID=2769488 RepID=UPI00188F50DB|nr:hypothetical protein [Nocardia sp. XZ_19_385]
MLGIYLENRGSNEEISISLEEYLKVSNSATVKAALSRCFDEIYELARADPQTGVKREITSNWQGVHDVDDADVAKALGTFAVAVGSDTTVLAPGLLDGLRAQVSYKIYVCDYYNFDHLDMSLKDPVEGFPRTANNSARVLEEGGLARSFIARGESPYVETWTQNL